MTSSGTTSVGKTVRATVSQWLEDVKSYFKLREAGVAPSGAYERVRASGESLQKAGAIPTRVPDAPRSIPRALRTGGQLSVERPATELAGLSQPSVNNLVKPGPAEKAPATGPVRSTGILLPNAIGVLGAGVNVLGVISTARMFQNADKIISDYLLVQHYKDQGLSFKEAVEAAHRIY